MEGRVPEAGKGREETEILREPGSQEGEEGKYKDSEDRHPKSARDPEEAETRDVTEPAVGWEQRHRRRGTEAESKRTGQRGWRG